MGVERIPLLRYPPRHLPPPFAEPKRNLELGETESTVSDVKKIAHIGIAVPDLESALELYRDRLGLALEEITEMPERGLKIAFLRAGEVLVELLAPLSEQSQISRFLEKRGPGIHHICFEVDDIRAKLQKLEAEGVRLIDREPSLGAEGYPVAFLHPKATGGVLMELLEES